MLLPLLLAGCETGNSFPGANLDFVSTPDAATDDPGEPAADAPDPTLEDVTDLDDTADAGDTKADASDDGCECDGESTCCDGCHPKAERRRCDPGDGGWGLCTAGRCVPIPGTVDEWTPDDIDAPIQAISLSTDGRFAAVALDATGDGTGGAVLWDLDFGEPVWTTGGDARGIAVRPGDGDLVAVGGTSVLVRAIADGTVALTLADASGPVAFSPDGTRLAASDGDEVGLFDLASGERLAGLPHALDAKAARWSVAFSPDGTRLASATGQSGLGSPHGDVRLFDLTGEEAPLALSCPSMGAAFSPDGTRLAAACWHSVIVWDATTGEVVGQRYDGDSVLSVAWSPDGRTLATGTLGSGIKFLDAAHVASGTPPLAVFPLVQARAVTFDPQGRRLIAASWMGPTLFVWTWDAPWPAWLEGVTPR